MQRATVVRRLFAYLIDLAAFSILTGMLGNIFIGNKTEIVELADKITLSVIFAIISVLFLSKDCIGGASIGKRMLNIGVRDYENHNEAPSKLRLFLRNLTTLLWPIEFIVLVASKDNRRLGDQLTKAEVFSTALIEKCRVCKAIGYNPNFLLRTEREKMVAEELNPIYFDKYGFCQECRKN